MRGAEREGEEEEVYKEEGSSIYKQQAAGSSQAALASQPGRPVYTTWHGSAASAG